jgi:cytochrome c5
VEEQTDSTFIKNVSIVMAVLVVFAIIIALLARSIGHTEDLKVRTNSVAVTKERIKPVADVYTGEEGAAAIQAATAAVTEEQAVAFDGSLDAEMIYNSVCLVCHGTGAAGAPIPGSEAMAQRAEKGMDAMLQAALNGLNAMPARGGRADLSDEQVRVVVEFMAQ